MIDFRKLFLIDLYAKIQYGLKFNHTYPENPVLLRNIYFDGLVYYVNYSNHGTGHGGGIKIFENDRILIKPYLRPMYSMTEEEDNEWRNVWIDDLLGTVDKYYPESEILLARSHSKSVEWLDSKMFDHRGLIEMNLAREAPKGMYK